MRLGSYSLCLFLVGPDGGRRLLVKVVLDERVDNGVDEVGDHGHHEVLPDHCDQGTRFICNILCEESFLLLGDGSLHKVLYFRGKALEHGQDDVNLVLTEAEDHEEGLQGNLHDGFSDERSAKEDAEGDQEVPAQEPGQVKQRVRNLKQ